jgi:DNA-binding CsgD family transcriptional regulator
MLFMNPMELDKNVTLHASYLGNAMKAIGTERYGTACLEVFTRSLAADHWTFFHHTPGRVTRIAAASQSSVPSGDDSIERFVTHCHRLDPALTTVSKNLREPMLVNKMDINDITDPRYRKCFELTGVTERLSLYSRYASDLYQLSIYRTGSGPSTLSAPELKHFTALASLIMITGLKHETISAARLPPQQGDFLSIEAMLERMPQQLSKRECEVCTRAAIGKTIEKTALELDIKPSSVITYRQRAYQKLGIRSQSELVALINGFRD